MTRSRAFATTTINNDGDGNSNNSSSNNNNNNNGIVASANVTNMTTPQSSQLPCLTRQEYLQQQLMAALNQNHSQNYQISQ